MGKKGKENKCISMTTHALHLFRNSMDNTTTAKRMNKLMGHDCLDMERKIPDHVLVENGHNLSVHVRDLQKSP